MIGIKKIKTLQPETLNLALWLKHVRSNRAWFEGEGEGFGPDLCHVVLQCAVPTWSSLAAFDNAVFYLQTSLARYNYVWIVYDFFLRNADKCDGRKLVVVRTCGILLVLIRSF